MDELELLKSKWLAREQEFPVISASNIYNMLLKKSSSIVKWIFYISIAELAFWTLINFFLPESSKLVIDEMGLKTLFLIISILNYLVFAFFIYLFYKNHQSIQVTDSVKELMKNILKTRKTVKYFVIYNVGASVLLLIGVNIHYYIQKDKLYDVITTAEEGYNAIPPELFNTVFFGSQLLGGIIMIILVLVFYRIIYGILLKRLKLNYDELEKMEM